MIRLFLIEWLKLRKSKSFLVLTGLYFVVVAFVCSGGMLFLEYLKSKGAQFRNIDPTIIPVYEFPDVWQNITFLAARLKIILAFIVIISLTNEIAYKTLRQNIIDGLNRVEFMFSKISMIIVLAVVNTLLVFLLGLINGFIYSQHTGFHVVFSNMSFLGAFFLNVFGFLILSFLLGLLIKRTGIVIVFLGIYAVFLEPIVTVIFTNDRQLPAFFSDIAPYFPVKAIRDLLPNPFPKYIFQEITDYVAMTNVALVSLQIVIYLTLIYLLLARRNNN